MEDGNHPKAVIEIKDVQKSLDSVFVHKGTITEGTVEVGGEVEAAVDAKLRQGAKVLAYVMYNMHLLANGNIGITYLLDSQIESRQS